jgi:hypothetical protein
VAVFALAYLFVATMVIPELRENKLVFAGGGLLALALGKLFGWKLAKIHSNGF